MFLIKSFLSFKSKSSGYVYVMRYLIIVFLILLPTAIIIHPLSDNSNISSEILPIIKFVLPFVIFLFLVQDFQRMNSLIQNRKIFFFFGLLTISYLLNYLTLWDDMFYFKVSGFFNWTFNIYLIFWNAKYDQQEERRLAKRLFNK